MEFTYYAPAQSRLYITNGRWAMGEGRTAVHVKYVGKDETERMVTQFSLNHRATEISHHLLDLPDGLAIIKSTQPLSVQWWRRTKAGTWVASMAVDQLHKGLHVGRWIRFAHEWRSEIVMIVDRRGDNDGVPSNRTRQFWTQHGTGINFPTFWQEDGGIDVFDTVLLSVEGEGGFMYDHEWAPGAGWVIHEQVATRRCAIFPLQWAGENQEWASA